MSRSVILWSGLGIVAFVALAAAIWIVSLPPQPAAREAPPVGSDETQAALAALKPPKRARPLIAIIGINNATEATDYLMPYGILQRAGIADVAAVATGAGPVKLYPALSVMPDATTADFDARHPDGADYVVVPAMEPDNDPAALDWIRNQASRGATIIGVCAGAKVVSGTGLLDGKRATTHWYYLKDMLRRHPAIRYVADRRLVVDGRFATTTGITASMPMMLTLIEAIAGRDKAEAVARELGVTHWDARHDSAAFRFTRPFALTAIANTLPFWRHERLGIALAPGIDEISLALVADAWSRTFRSRAVAFAGSADPVKTRSGIRIIPDEVATGWPAERMLPAIGAQPPAAALDLTLRDIGARYGERTAAFVAMQLEYPRSAGPRQHPIHLD